MIFLLICSKSFSLKVLSGAWSVTFIATDFLSLGMLSPSKTSNVVTFWIKEVSTSFIIFSSKPILKILSITKAKSLSDFWKSEAWKLFLFSLIFLFGSGMFFKNISNPKTFGSLKSNFLTIAGWISPKYAKRGPFSDLSEIDPDLPGW